MPIFLFLYYNYLLQSTVLVSLPYFSLLSFLFLPLFLYVMVLSPPHFHLPGLRPILSYQSLLAPSSFALLPGYTPHHKQPDSPVQTAPACLCFSTHHNTERNTRLHRPLLACGISLCISSLLPACHSTHACNMFILLLQLSICLSLRLFICLSLYLHFCISICLTVNLFRFVCLYFQLSASVFLYIKSLLLSTYHTNSLYIYPPLWANLFITITMRRHNWVVKAPGRKHRSEWTLTMQVIFSSFCGVV